MTQAIPEPRQQILSVKLPGIILGIGLGGFFDGIFLHQLLQWHHMFSSQITVDTVQGLQMNTLGDGGFHTITWLAVLLGLYILYSRVTEARREVWGSAVLWAWILVGWGLFNVVEGTIDHQILGLHHVRSGPYQLWWDMGFLAFGALLIGIGWMIQSDATPVRYARTRT
jgi:uncharacterized membrane protein